MDLQNPDKKMSKSGESPQGCIGLMEDLGSIERKIKRAVTDADTVGTCALGQTFTYAWSLTRPPSSVTALLSDPAASSPSFTPDVPGTYRATLTVTDSTGLSSQIAVHDVVVSACGIPN